MDTSGWIEFFRKSEVGEQIRELLLDGKITTPSIVLGELRSVYVKGAFDDERFSEDYAVIRFMGDIEDLSSDVAILAGEMRATCGIKDISLVDCIILTLAKLVGGKAISTDEHFKNQENAMYFPVEA